MFKYQITEDMASGIVAKKIALFEIKPQTYEQQCRLKRKHAIRRKRYRGKERRIVTREGTSMIALSTSDEHINHLKDYDEESTSSSSSSAVYQHSSQFSASCSALFDLMSVESSVLDKDDVKAKVKNFPMNKKLLLKSASRDKLSKKINIFDIDIEIKIEKKEQEVENADLPDPEKCESSILENVPSKCSVSSTPGTVTTDDVIRLLSLVENNESAERSLTYYCSKCTHDDKFEKKDLKNRAKDDDKNKESDTNAVDNPESISPEPLYQNVFSCAPPPPISLGAPPLPPKRLFGDSFTTNYSCLPSLKGKARAAAKTPSSLANSEISSNGDKIETKKLLAIDSSIVKPSLAKCNNKEKASSDTVRLLKAKSTSTANNTSTDTKLRAHVTDPCDDNLHLLKTINDKEVTTKEESLPAICLEIDNKKEFAGNQCADTKQEPKDDEEPFYEDLYDYCCNGTDKENKQFLNPLLLELFRDQFNSLEQNVEDEVEYCDCTTVLSFMKTATENEENNEQAIPAKNNYISNCEPFSAETENEFLRSYEIYDDCFGIVATTASNTNQQNEDGDDGGGGSKNNNNPDFSIFNDNDLCSMPNSGTEINQTACAATSSTTNSTSSHIPLADYIKAAKASTPGCWRKITSSVATEESTGNSTKKQISTSSSPSPTLTSSDLLSSFPSLSVPKSKLAEPKEETKCTDESQSAETLPNEATSFLYGIHSKDKNFKTKNTNSGCIYCYGMLKSGNNQNGNNSKPKFGGRPVIAHPLNGDGKAPEDHVGYDNENKCQNKDDLPTQRCYQKDDNEIFNKPLPLPPSTSPYESVYEEPIYGITNQLTATYSDNGKPGSTGGGGSPGKRRSSAPAAPFVSNKLLSNSKPGSTYSHSPSISSGSTYGYSSGSVNDYGDACSIPKPSQSSGVTSPSSINTVSTTASDGMSIYGINDKLPPTPPSKFSSIAKTAGRKIAKKFLGIRKTSKCGFEDSLATFSTNDSRRASLDVVGSCATANQQGSSSYLQGSKGINPAVTNFSNNGTQEEKITNHGANGGSGGGSGAQVRRPISRPSIPPPEPPKNEVSTTIPPPLLDKENDYIYNKKNDDDYEDSDFYDSDSELIRNFVSQVQPIYSMEEEPLYQYYTYGISLKPDDDYQPVIPKNLGLTLDMLVPRVGQRTLWCELSGVVSSGILSILSDKQKQLQEAIFEILTSEVSYLKSLDILITLFYKNEELIGLLTEDEKLNLFGNIENVRDCSHAFLSELLGKWEESWYIQEIGEIISRNTETRFSVYKEYCRNKPFQDKAMQKLRHTRDEFVSVVKAIEEDERCQMLQIDSFLMLPMQRITRLPLLVNAVIQRTAPGKEKNKCEEALKCLTNLVLSCNDAARESQDAEETMAILEKLEFTRGIKALPDLGQFFMKGDFMKNPFDHGRGGQLNWTFRKTKRTFYWLLLFSKQLLVARRKTNGRFEIIDMIDPLESSIKALPNLEGISKDFKHFFMLHFSRKETVYFLAARTNSEVERWKSKLDAMKPKEELKVEAIFPYEARRPDEMSFYVGDIIRVSQMQPDGWYYGTKLATGESGWFPGNYCCENAP